MDNNGNGTKICTMSCPAPKRVRTRAQARMAGALEFNGQWLMDPICPGSEDALTTVPCGGPHLRIMKRDVMDLLQYEDGRFYRNGKPVGDAWLSGCRDEAAPADMSMIYMGYALVAGSLEDVTGPYEIDRAAGDPAFYGRVLKFYVPDLVEFTGTTPSVHNDAGRYLAGRIEGCRNIVGVVPGLDGPEHYAALVLVGHDTGRNIISIASPYFHKVALNARRRSILWNGDGSPAMLPGRRPAMLPVHSDLISSRILSERSKPAIEVVRAVINKIERSDGTTPSITAREILDRCPGLQRLLAGKSAYKKNMDLERTFGKAWELLRTRTRLAQAYPGIRIPDEAPTVKNMDVAFRFPYGQRTGIAAKG